MSLLESLKHANGVPERITIPAPGNLQIWNPGLPIFTFQTKLHFLFEAVSLRYLNNQLRPCFC